MDEASLPIDIQCRKLLDWLISRRICNREWHERICKVKKITNLLTLSAMQLSGIFIVMMVNALNVLLFRLEKRSGML